MADRSAPVAPAKADVAEITRDFLLKFGWRYTAAMLAAQVSLEWSRILRSWWGHCVSANRAGH